MRLQVRDRTTGEVIPRTDGVRAERDALAARLSELEAELRKRR